MKNFFYRVQHTDSLISVAEHFGTCVFKIIENNKLKSEIAEGDVLFIERENGKLYSVAPAETLEDVLNKFGLSKEEFYKKNGKVPYLFYGLKVKV